MRLRRILAAAVVTTLAAPTALLTTATGATAAPARAGTTPVHIVGSGPNNSWLYSSGPHSQPGATVYGETLSLSIEVRDDSGSQISGGSLKVQRQLPGRAWTTVKTSATPYLYDSMKAVSNARYRALYSGSDTYESDVITGSLAVQRKISIRDAGGRRVVLVGKVAPRYHGKVTILKKAGKRWTRYKVLRTNSRSQFKTPLPAPRRGKYYWKVQIAASRTFAKSQTGTFYTYTT